MKQAIVINLMTAVLIGVMTVAAGNYIFPWKELPIWGVAIEMVFAFVVLMAFDHFNNKRRERRLVNNEG